jgi:hypothetical protein
MACLICKALDNDERYQKETRHSADAERAYKQEKDEKEAYKQSWSC